MHLGDSVVRLRLRLSCNIHSSIGSLLRCFLNSVYSFLGCFLSSLDGFLSLFLYSFDSFLYLLFDLRLFVGQLVELLCHDSSFGMTDAFCTEVVADDGADVSVCAYNSAPRT